MKKPEKIELPPVKVRKHRGRPTYVRPSKQPYTRKEKHRGKDHT